MCAGCPTGGVIAKLEVPERFRWFDSHRSSCIQTSRPHVGYSDNLEETLERLVRGIGSLILLSFCFLIHESFNAPSSLFSQTPRSGF